jgi:hypothetical protein
MKRTITVPGAGSVVVEPDVASVRLGVNVLAKTAGAARETAAKTMQAVLDAVLAQDVARRDVRTSLVSLNPTMDYSDGKGPRVTGYQVQNSVSVTLRDLSRTGELIDAALSAGASTLDSLDFQLENPTSAAAEARAAATPEILFPTAAERSDHTERTTGRGTSRLGSAARIAAVVAIVLLGGWNLLLQGQLSDARAYDRAIAAVIDAAGKPGSQTVVLTPVKDSRASGIAAVAPNGAVFMAMRDLPATAGTQVYEAWVIVGKQDPVPVGGFTVGPTGTAAFTTQPVATPPGSTIALSLEPAPGSTKPLGTIVAAGVSVAPGG